MTRLPSSILVLSLLWALPGLGAEPVRGDLPPGGADHDLLRSTDLSGPEAEALFERLHQLLMARVGADLLSDSDLYLGAMQGMIEAANRRLREEDSPRQASLPSAGMLLRDADAARLAEGLTGRMTGIGIEFQLYGELGLLGVSRVLPGSPAEKAGLRTGDRVVALDGRGFAGAGIEAVVDMLQGTLGSAVILDVVRGDGMAAARMRVRLQREPFDVRSVDDELQSDGLGFLRIYQFHAGTPAEVEEALGRLTALGADRFLIDLRNNPGGDVRAAAKVADLFLPEKTVLMRVVEPGRGESDLVAEGPARTDAPLAVLVNSWTLGAAEALVAALQDHGRAYLIGEPTMGVARTQTLVPLGSGLTLRLDSVRLQSPTGRSWQGQGILPDLPIWGGTPGDTEGPGSFGLDPQFETAVHYLQIEAEPDR